MMFGINHRHELIEVAFSMEHLDHVIDDPEYWETFRERLKAYYLAQKERLRIQS